MKIRSIKNKLLLTKYIKYIFKIKKLKNNY